MKNLLRIIHTVVCISSLLTFITEPVFHICLFIFLVEGHQVFAIMNKGVLDIYLYVRTDALIILGEIYRNHIIALYGGIRLTLFKKKR